MATRSAGRRLGENGTIDSIIFESSNATRAKSIDHQGEGDCPWVDGDSPNATWDGIPSNGSMGKGPDRALVGLNSSPATGGAGM